MIIRKFLTLNIIACVLGMIASQTNAQSMANDPKHIQGALNAWDQQVGGPVQGSAKPDANTGQYPVQQQGGYLPSQQSGLSQNVRTFVCPSGWTCTPPKKEKKCATNL